MAGAGSRPGDDRNFTERRVSKQAAHRKHHHLAQPGRTDETAPAIDRRLPGNPPIPIRPPVTITPYRDGPLLVRGPVTLVAPDGTPITCDRDPIALCRCGKSKLKPFCDGTHKLIRFRAPSGRSEERP
jgi:CDGSH-type Zn-finger protein